MTPKEKADELVDKYRNTIMSFLSDNMKDMNAKNCALIAVDEVFEFMKMDDEFHDCGHFANSQWVDYYIKLKQEIEKL